jgi:hypothetical protein
MAHPVDFSEEDEEISPTSDRLPTIRPENLRQSFLRTSTNDGNIETKVSMGNHLRENDIELFVLSPLGLDAGRHKQMADHLANCDQCNAVASLLRSFYSELEDEPWKLQNVEEFLSALLPPPSVYALHPYRYTPDPAEFGEHIMTVLAAKSESPNRYQYSSMCTLISRDEQIVVRVLKDNDTKIYKVFMITRRGMSILNATIRFPALNLTISISSDTRQAEFSLSPTQSGIDWTNIVAELRVS